MRETKSLAALAAGAVIAAGAPAAVMGASLVSIGVLDPTSTSTAYSEPRAVSHDGSYVVGTSQAPGGTVKVPVVWSASSGLVALPNPSGADSIGIGVSVGIGSNAGNIIIAGLHEGNNTAQRYYKAPLANLASGSWADCAAAGSLPLSDMRGGSYNDLRSDPGVGDGRWYTAGKQYSTSRNARLRGDPFIGWNGTAINNVTSVSAYGVNVGRSSASPSTAFVEGPAFTFTNVPGSSGVRADGIGISPSFGKATEYSLQWVCGQVNSYSGNTQMQGFRWMRGDASLTPLGTLTGHTSSCAYTVADNGLTAGRSYISGGETAVVWDTSGTWDATGAAKSVKALLEAQGVDTSAWSSLRRVYAVSDDGRALAGYGIWAADGSTRGFVAYSGPVVVKGACCVTTGLGTGTCSMVSSDECAALGGRYLGDGYQCGTAGSACGGFCPVPFADADVDGAVDQQDFGAFQACFTGGGIFMLSDACKCLDRNRNSAVDSDDYAEFLKCITGPMILFTTSLRPDCAPGTGQLP